MLGKGKGKGVAYQVGKRKGKGKGKGKAKGKGKGTAKGKGKGKAKGKGKGKAKGKGKGDGKEEGRGEGKGKGTEGKKKISPVISVISYEGCNPTLPLFCRRWHSKAPRTAFWAREYSFALTHSALHFNVFSGLTHTQSRCWLADTSRC